MSQLTMNLGALSGTEVVAPYAEGDVLQTKFGRVVVTHADRDANDKQVCVCVSLETGNSLVVLEREILYRSR
jgi:hypothetical protein